MKKKLFLSVLLAVTAFCGPAFAGECVSRACSIWVDCIDPDDAKTNNMCEDQEDVARHMMDNMGKAELYAAHELVGVCKDYAVCTRLENGACGWKPTLSAYFDCAQHPQKYDK